MKNINPIAYNHQIVATYSVLAGYLGTDERRLSENFKRNVDRFIEGMHYFKLPHDNAQRVVLNYQGFKGLTVWTERGCARYSKILQTDEAWELWEDMEEIYFVNKNTSFLPDFTNPAEAARAWADDVETKAVLEVQIKLDAPKVRFAETLTESSNIRCVRVTRADYNDTPVLLDSENIRFSRTCSLQARSLKRLLPTGATLSHRSFDSTSHGYRLSSFIGSLRDKSWTIINYGETCKTKDIVPRKVIFTRYELFATFTLELQGRIKQFCEAVDKFEEGAVRATSFQN